MWWERITEEMGGNKGTKWIKVQKNGGEGAVLSRRRERRKGMLLEQTKDGKEIPEVGDKKEGLCES
jgi:hypothetical protein